MAVQDSEEILSAPESARAADLLRLLPKTGGRALDIGARGGRFARMLSQYYQSVTALDLIKPPYTIPGVETVAGNVTALEFADNSFDCVFCAEVLEHVPEIERGCAEIQRVARRDVLIGVPFRQDLRISRTTCATCGKIGAAWGHVNQFDEARLRRLFPALELQTTSYIWPERGATNALASWLMDLGGNPWGAYDQQEPCFYCGARLIPPTSRTIGQKLSSKAADLINTVQTAITPAKPFWIHVLFRKK